MAKRHVEHFSVEFYHDLNTVINHWLSTHTDMTIVGISVYPIIGKYSTCYGAEVIVEEVMWNG